MSLLSPVYRAAGKFVFNRPARKKVYAQVIHSLKQNQDNVLARLEAAEQSDRNHAVMTHIIGIERWAQARLRTLLGEPMDGGEYDPYRPSADTPWSELATLFEDARQETIELARTLEAKGIETETAPHNMFGDLTPRGWMVYLEGHAATESKRLR